MPAVNQPQQIPFSPDRTFLVQWLILVGVLLLLGGFVAQGIHAEHARIEATEQASLSTQAKVVEQNMGRQLEAISRALAGLRYDLSGWVKQKDGDERLAQRIKALIDAMPGVRTIMLTNDQGVVTASNRPPLLGQNLSTLALFQAPLHKPSLATLYVSPPYTTSLGVYSMSVTRAIVDEDGHFSGVISATLAPAEFEVLMNSVRYAPDMWGAVAHGDGTMFMMAPENKALSGKNLRQPGTFFTRHLASGNQADVYSGIVYLTGEDRMIAARTVNPEQLQMDYPLMVAVSRDRSLMFAEWSQSARIQLFVFGFLVIAVAYGLYLYQRRQREYLSERELMALRLREASVELDRFFTLSLDLLCIADMQGHFRRLNRAWETVLGYSLEELEGATFLDYVHPEDIEATVAAMSELSVQKNVIGFINRYRCKDGDYRWIEWHSVPYEENYVYAVARDITEQKLAEADKESQMRIQQALLNSIRETVFLMERDGTLLLINEVGAQRLNARPEELVGRSFFDIIPRPVAETRRAGFDRVAQSGLQIRVDDEREGHRFSTSIYPIKNRQGVVTQFAVYAAEVTQQRRQQDIDDMLSSINQSILQGAPLKEVLLVICQKLAELFQFEVVWLGRKEADGGLSVMAAAGSATAYVEQMREQGVRWDDTPSGRGPSGSAIRFGQPQLFKTSDARFQPWAEIARQNNLQAILALPLVVRSDIYGVFTVYSSRASLLEGGGMIDLLNGIGKRICIALEAAMDQQQVRLLSSALEAAGNGVMITDPKGKILWVNPAFSKLCGYSKPELLGQTPRIMKSGQQTSDYYQALWATISVGEHWSSETIERAKDGTLYTVSQTITPIMNEGKITHFIAIHEDISAQKLTQQRIAHMAHFDALTGLPNRALFYDRLHNALLLAKRNEASLALLYMDLDVFKKVNDTQGHQTGDALLIAVAQRLAKCVRESDTVARLGGDEFTILLNEIHNPEDATAVAQKIVEVISEPFELEGGVAKIGISIGIACYSDELNSEDVLVKNADQAMYEAKQAGKNTYRLSAVVN